MITKLSNLAEYTNVSGSNFVPIVDVNETVNSKNKKITVDSLRKYFFNRNNLTSSFTKHTPGFYYFGDNSDGNGIFTGSISSLRTRISASFASTQDGPGIIRNFSTLFVSRSVIIKPTNRCRGMVIFVDGDATISGSISMTARGAKFTGSDASFQVYNPPYLGDYWSTLLFPSSSYLSRVFAVGASGGTGGSADGVTGVGGRSGGGGAGSSYGAPTSALGSAGTSFSGGSGGGGASVGSPAVQNAAAYGGSGGNGTSPGGGGGAGNPGGTGGGGGENGTGGLLILIVKGNLKIGPNGSITTNGSNGAPSTPAPTSGGAGGGSGGGVLYIYYGGTLTNYGTVTANGGSRGPIGNLNPAGNGGAGTLVLSKYTTTFPLAN